MKYLLVTSILCLTSSLSWAKPAAETAEKKGLRIAMETNKFNSGFQGESSKMIMKLYDAHGASTERIMKGKTLEVKGDGDKSLSIFEKPLDVKNTKMLTWSHKEGDDDQWLYLPSFKRWKRISSNNKSSSFMGSEFSFEDLGSQEPEKYNYKWLRDEKISVDGSSVNAWVLERKPKKKSGYSKQVLWMDQDKKNPAKIEYYDRKGELLKTAEFSKFKSYKISGKTVWRPNIISMKNIQTKKSSTIEWQNRKLGQKFKSKEFKKSNI